MSIIVHYRSFVYDVIPSTQPGFCGGSVNMTDSSPEFALFTRPLYDNPSGFDV